MKSARRILTLAPVGLVLLLLLVALPAGAAPSEDLDIIATITFDIASGTMHGTGTWDATDGLIVGEGAAEEDDWIAGYPPGYIFKTAHPTETWADEYGTITIQTQLNVDEWTIDDFPCDTSFSGSGNWVIMSGTGAYEHLRGQGRVTMVGEITPDSCPYLNVVEEYQGSGHFDP
jgi:hypothetical protein